MKLRIYGNSLRLRLSPNDLDVMLEEGRVESWTGFGPDKRFVYALETNPDIETLVAEFDQDALTLAIPSAWLEKWSEDERIGFESMQAIDGDQKLHLLVEKDMGCRHTEAASPAEEAG